MVLKGGAGKGQRQGGVVPAHRGGAAVQRQGAAYPDPAAGRKKQVYQV